MRVLGESGPFCRVLVLDGPTSSREGWLCPNWSSEVSRWCGDDPKQVDSQGESPMGDNFQGFTRKAGAAVGSAARQVRAAAVLIVKQAVRAKITALNLPRAYRALGKHVFNAGSYRPDFASIFQEIDGCLDAIKAVQARSANEPKPEGMAGKVRAAVLMVRDAARIKVLQLKADRAFSELGKAAFGKFGVQSGPDEVTGPIAAYLSRIQEIDAEIGQLSEPGRIVTPRRLAVGMVVAIAMLCCVALLATGPTPEQKRIKRAALAYRSVPSSARDALNAVEKLESRIEVGMNHGD